MYGYVKINFLPFYTQLFLLKISKNKIIQLTDCKIICKL